jgi:hypothetical protein
MSLNGVDQGFPTWETRPPRGTREAGSGDASLLSQLGLGLKTLCFLIWFTLEGTHLLYF